MRLHKFYMNGNPNNNLDDNPIGGPLVGMDNLAHKQISRSHKQGCNVVFIHQDELFLMLFMIWQRL